MLTAALLALATVGAVEAKAWSHGAADCASSQDPPIDVLSIDGDTHILRQGKCVHFEAPFMYLLLGRTQALLLDTGATADAKRFPLYAKVRELMGTRQHLPLLVAHTHGHADHVAGDAQFRGQPGVTLVEPTARAVRGHFGFDRWPEGAARLDLGGRVITVMPVPGHHDEHIALFDARTGWLLTGDTVYPGRLYVRRWDEYRASVRKLAAFAQAHTVTAVMGTHVEIARDGELYEPGATHQPNEMPLALPVKDLVALDGKLAQAPEAARIALDKFTVMPVPWFFQTLGTIRQWLRLD